MSQPSSGRPEREAVRLMALDEFDRIRKGEPVGDPYDRVARILEVFDTVANAREAGDVSR